MESNQQNGKKIKLSQIYLNKQGTKNQCQVDVDQPKFFSVLAEKFFASYISNVPVNLKLNKNIAQSIFLAGNY